MELSATWITTTKTHYAIVAVDYYNLVSSREKGVQKLHLLMKLNTSRNDYYIITYQNLIRNIYYIISIVHGC